MSLLTWARRLAPDAYVMAIMGMVVAASLLPVRGQAAQAFEALKDAAIALLFFLHGAKLSREAVIGGVTHWRLHLVVLAATFALFPLIGLGLSLLPAAIFPAAFWPGFMFLCCLPSTVQSSIAFTSLARGNVAGAVCAASLSNLLGVAVTPVLVGLFLGGHTAGDLVGSIRSVGLQLLAPFVLGQIARPWLVQPLKRHARVVGWVDRGSILLVVYGAFSAAVVEGLWTRVSPGQITALIFWSAALLALALGLTLAAARLLRFNLEDEITIVFCGSKKSLASGVPMAGILFPAAAVGPMVLPLMIFHQLQLMACAVIAQSWASRPGGAPES